MANSESRKKMKRSYEKPVLRKISIQAGVQTLGIGCKTATGGGTGAPVAVPCWSSGCAQEGS